MKKFIGIFVIIVMGMTTFVACDPVENRNDPGGAVSQADIDKNVTVTQEVREGKKSNFFKYSVGNLQALTQFKNDLGIIYGSTADYVQSFLFPGPAQIVLTVLNPDGSKLTKTYDFTVDEAFDVAPQWDMLTASSSKTWVFDGTGGDNRIWWAMTDPNDPGAVWWNAGGTCCPPSDASGHMVFSAKGLTIATYSSPSDANPKTGTFSFNSDFTEFTVSGNVNILGSEGSAGNSGKFKVVNLTNNTMKLHVSNASGGTGWVWVFKPQ